jgi:hypothetical protein
LSGRIFHNIISHLNFLIFLLFLFINCPLLAQSYEFRITKIVDEKGEVPGATFAIVEDSIGFLWFGTVDGLYRYDGYNYKIFRNEKENPNSLGWNTIRVMALGKYNKIWIGTRGLV